MGVLSNSGSFFQPDISDFKGQIERLLKFNLQSGNITSMDINLGLEDRKLQNNLENYINWEIPIPLTP